MIRIQVRPNEPLESALRRFKRQCNYAGIFRLAKKYNYFEKKSDRERRERRERIRTMQRAQRRAMGPTKVRRTAKKSKFRKGGSDSGEQQDVSVATAAALEEKGKELLRDASAGPADPASAADVAAAVSTAPTPSPTPDSAE
ncbi:MAG: 30S ribosomal protein S21 [Planctomycetota bacterium]|nr:30S ribosomal protein S21 [Planctomycetota bacterium]